MSRLFTCGYETGDIGEAGVSTIGNATLSAVSSSPTPRAGNYCLKVASTTTSVSPTHKGFALPSSRTEVWVRFAFYAHLTEGVLLVIARWIDAGGSNSQTSLGYSSADGLLRLYRGSGTVIGTSSSGFAEDSWHVIDWRTQILSTTTGNSEIWADGTQVLTFSGDNTNSSNATVQTLLLGFAGTTVYSTANPTDFFAFDDIAINDLTGTRNNGRMGDGRVALLVPTGAGSSTMLARGGTDTGANWSQVNERPSSMTQYVASATAADRDLYAMSNLGTAAGSINVVEEVVLAQNSDAGAGSIGLTIKSGSTINEATAQTLAAGAAYKTARWETDPNTSAAWTSSAVDALECGVTVR